VLSYTLRDDLIRVAMENEVKLSSLKDEIRMESKKLEVWEKTSLVVKKRINNRKKG
jgi:hypothetical protein